jgi:hypothetical protein
VTPLPRQGEEKSDAFDFETYERLLKAQEREGRAMTSLASKMRLNRASIDDRWRQPAPPATAPKPWQD